MKILEVPLLLGDVQMIQSTWLHNRAMTLTSSEVIDIPPPQSLLEPRT